MRVIIRQQLKAFCSSINDGQFTNTTSMSLLDELTNTVYFYDMICYNVI